MTETIETEITRMFNIKYPIILAGMNKAAGPELAGAVSNAGGLGVIGGVNYTPRVLKMSLDVLKKHLNGDLPFGVDLLLPQVGEGARATNYDYTHGNLDKLIDIIIDSGAKLFVSAVGVPPKRVVDKLHKAGLYVMNMVGHPKHVAKACSVGVDIICAQGGEGGGHTGHVPTSLLIPACADLVRKYLSPMTGKPVQLVAAGGIYDGRSLAMALSLGANAVWVGTRFVASVESGAPLSHKRAIIKANYDSTQRTLVFTGRPMRVIKNSYATMWETRRTELMNKLLKEGTIPADYDRARLAKAASANQIKKKDQNKKDPSGQIAVAKAESSLYPALSGQVAGAIEDIQPAAEIIQDMMSKAIQVLRKNERMISLTSKL